MVNFRNEINVLTVLLLDEATEFSRIRHDDEKQQTQTTKTQHRFGWRLGLIRLFVNRVFVPRFE